MNSGKFNEESKYDPHSPYSASKAASDHFVRAFYDTYKLPIIISNCSNNYGPNQNKEKLIPTIIYNLIKIQIYLYMVMEKILEIGYLLKIMLMLLIFYFIKERLEKHIVLVVRMNIVILN